MVMVIVSFIFEMILHNPMGGVIYGLIPSTNETALHIAIGIIGATVINIIYTCILWCKPAENLIELQPELSRL
jgi:fructose-specific phosphotransferase system IIC component